MNRFKNYVLKHYFKIESKDDKLIFHLKNKFPLADNDLMIKHRRSGKRILKRINGSKVEVTCDDFNEIGELGVYDIYIQAYAFNRYFLLRTNFDLQNCSKSLFDKENHIIINSIPTNYDNLSFRYEECMFLPKLIDYTIEGTCLKLDGEFEVADDAEFDRLELLIDFNGSRVYVPGDFEKNGNLVKFKFDIDFDLDEDKITSKILVRVRLIKDEIIIDSARIKIHEIKRIDDEYLGFINNCPTNDDLGILYYFDGELNFNCKVTNSREMNKRIRNDKRLLEYNNSRSNKKLVLLESFHGKSYAGQPKYIYEKMLEMGLDKHFDFIWSYDGDVEIPGSPLITSRSTKQFRDFLRNSDYWITNISFPILKENKDIVYLQTTHGTPYKHMGSDIDTQSENVQKGRVLIESATWNYVLSPNDFSKDVFKRAFEYDGEIINRGYPANDVFYQDKEDFKRKLKKDLNIPEDKKIILYAPTFRDYRVDVNKQHQFDLLLDLEEFHKNLSDDYVLVVRLHYLLSKNLKLTDELKEFVFDLSDYDDIADLYLISDMLITDYSSVFFDFAHSKKPILFFVPDYEEYLSFRGLYSEIKQNLPGPEIATNADLIESIKNIDAVNEEYKDKYDNFYERYCSLGHGTASEDVINIVFGDVING